MKNAQILYYSHGGGPLPLLNDPDHHAMVTFMRGLPGQLHRPEGIVIFSAHWEEDAPTLTASDALQLLFDYYGFPPETYQYTYPFLPNLAIAQKVSDALKLGGIQPRMTATRGMDHGAFIPMMLMYPEGGIPIVQLSLIRGLSAQAHLELGKALRSLLSENILFIGSGFSFHNMRQFFSNPAGTPDPQNDVFQNWLLETCSGDLPAAEREERLLNWDVAPSARYCHPREEHLLPLHICAGLAGTNAECVFDDRILNKRALGFCWNEIVPAR